jgi:signal transduction histidine kinase
MSGGQLIESVLSMFQSRVTNSGIRVEQHKRTSQAVRCFEGEIRQVLSNLVSNAIDVMQSQGGGLCYAAAWVQTGPPDVKD